jgi:hypothetical protein
LVAAGTVTMETAKIFADDARLIGPATAGARGASEAKESSHRHKGNLRNPFSKKDN